MKILVIELERIDPSVLFESDQMVHLRYLMTTGCWGTLEAGPDVPWRALAEQVSGICGEACSQVVLRARTGRPDTWKELDKQIRSRLESITEDTVVLVICVPPGGAPGCFVLAAPNSAVTGRLEGVRLDDIAATLLTLGGFPPLPGSQGVSLAVPVAPGSGADDDEMIRERLRGLGYIA
ncbi:MAG: hypothetical protein ACE15E_07575 [Acidobacteriota bacterium]